MKNMIHFWYKMMEENKMLCRALALAFKKLTANMMQYDIHATMLYRNMTWMNTYFSFISVPYLKDHFVVRPILYVLREK